MSGMDKTTFARAMAPLMTVYQQDIDKFVWSAYFNALKDIPERLLTAAVSKALATRSWFPKPAELRADAESCRLELLAQNPYLGCEECDDHRGWRSTTRQDGVPCVERCPCVRRHQQKLASLGADSGPLALPPARESQFEQVTE